MSTRCVIEFKDSGGSFFVYQHMDGYPDGEHGVHAAITTATERAWPLPRFEADEFGAAYIATHKVHPGNLRLMRGPQDVPADAEYWHVVTQTQDEGPLAVNTYSCDDCQRGTHVKRSQINAKLRVIA